LGKKTLLQFSWFYKPQAHVCLTQSKQYCLMEETLWNFKLCARFPRTFSSTPFSRYS